MVYENVPSTGYVGSMPIEDLRSGDDWLTAMIGGPDGATLRVRRGMDGSEADNYYDAATLERPDDEMREGRREQRRDVEDKDSDSLLWQAGHPP